jgi:O-antigen ligase
MKRWLLPGGSYQAAAWILLLVATLLLPFAVLPAATDSFILPKIILLQVLALLGGGALFAAMARGQRFTIHFEPVGGLLVLFLLWQAASLIWSPTRALTLAEVGEQATYIFLYFYLGVAVAGMRSRVLRLLQALLLGSLGVALLVLVQDFRAAFAPESIAVKQVLGDWRDALSAVSLGNTSHLGDLLALGSIGWLASFFMALGWIRWVAVGALIVHSAALIVCWSVHSNLSLIIACAAFAWLMRPFLPRRALPRIAIPGAVLLVGWLAVVGFHAIDHPLNPHGSAVWSDGSRSGGIFQQAFSSPRWTSGLDTRLAIWLTTLDIVRENGWLGTGAGTFTWIYPATTTPLVYNNPSLAMYSGSWTNAAHNEVLQTWAELGIVGVFLLLAIVAASLMATMRRLRQFPSAGTAMLLAASASGLLAIVLQAQMNFPLQLPLSSFLFILLLAMPVLLPRSVAEPAELLVPVERPYGPLQVGVTMLNMSHPIMVFFRLELPRAMAAVVPVLVLAVALAASWQAVQPLHADIAYRPVREARLRLRQSGQPAASENLIAMARGVLAIWPGHVDCRSALQDMLLLKSRFEEVVEETPLVLQRLNATEVYARREAALRALGREQEANRDRRIITARQPR